MAWTFNGKSPPPPSKHQYPPIVSDWSGSFGNLRLYGTIRVGKDRQSWQELECYLFAEMLICVKEKKGTAPPQWDEEGSKGSKRKTTRCTLKGSILIKKHLKQVSEATHGESIHQSALSTETGLR